MRKTWNFYSGQQLIFGEGAVDRLASVGSRLSATRAIVITDEVIHSLGIVDDVLVALKSAGIESLLFDGGVVEPSTDTVSDAAEVASKFDPDLFVAVGGGSNMDLAKLTCVVNSHGGVPTDYLGVDNVPGSTKPLVCIPTTAGTGSEVSHSAVIHDSRQGIKTSALSPYIRPAFAIVDPRMSASCPERLTAESGFDALVHAIESYLATPFDCFSEGNGAFLPYEGNHPLGDIYAEKAIRLIGKNLEKSVNTPGDMHARAGMALAATLAGVAFAHGGVTLAHALEYSIGNTYRCSHGVGNAILIPEVMQFLLPAREQKLAEIGSLLGLPTRNANDQTAAQSAIEAVKRLRSAVGLPGRLRDVGGQLEDLPAIAGRAIRLQRLIDLSARRPTESDLLGILETSF
ncbi:MAG: iron-containing alcohol dehydrogenase [Planctomycetota bacterium]